MGPPPFGDGKGNTSLTIGIVEVASMGPPPFGDGKRASRRRRRRRVRSFNGATAFRRWKGAGSYQLAGANVRLQWGHRLSAMESGVNSAGQKDLNELQWGHRLSAMESMIANEIPTGMNPLQWGHRLSAMERIRGHPGPAVHGLASMGPPPFGDGKLRRIMAQDAVRVLLQWGHRLSAMESGGRHGSPGVEDLASMGPPPFGDGKLQEREGK